MSELLEVQKMLESKSRQVAQREQEVKHRERQLEMHKQRAIQAVRDEYDRLMSEHETRVTKETHAVIKKVSAAERNLQNKIKLAGSGSQSASRVSQSEVKG
jgi:phosphoserine phosphatase